jgi:hypothetical protein
VLEVEAAWGVMWVAVHCERCGVAHLVPAEAPPECCPLCMRGSVRLQPIYLRPEPPEQVVPYALSEARLDEILTRWAGGGLLRPDDLRPERLAARVQRYLLPLWLVDARVTGPWRAEVGFDYQVVSHQDRYREGGGWQSHQVEETRVRWEPRVGRLDRVYENVDAPALEDHRAVMARLGAVDRAERTAYAPGEADGAVVRVPTLAPEAAWPQAELALVRAAEEECRAAAGAEHVRRFEVEAAYRDQNWTLLLLPAYVTWYREGGEVWPLLINGQSGHVDGVRRASARKARSAGLALGIAAAVLFLLGGLLAILGAVLPPAAVVGAVLLVVGAGLGLAAPLPLIAAWARNRRSTLAGRGGRGDAPPEDDG